MRESIIIIIIIVQIQALSPPFQKYWESPTLLIPKNLHLTEELKENMAS
jgi:hypothetical protein